MEILNMMELTTELRYTIEILMLLSFSLGFLSGYLYVHHRIEHKLNTENDKLHEKDKAYQNL